MPKTEPWRGRWALVTGASAGIGRAIAEELAEGGAKLVLAARRGERLEALARTLRKAHGAAVETVSADLAREDGPERVFAFTEERGIAVDLLVNNAGAGAYGAFHASELERALDIVRLNCAAVVALTRRYIAQMVARRSGDVLIVSSTGAFQAVPYLAVYAASKGFDLLFAEALAAETKPYGVRVCALCPGPTESEFAEQARVPASLATGMDDARRVARTGLRALAAGEYSVICGYGNWLGVQLQRVAPRRFATAAAEMLLRPPGE